MANNEKQYYELYRRSTVGTTLTDTLDELISEQRLEPQLAMKIISNFDKAIADVLGDKVKSRLTFKGHLDTYRFCDDVWTFIIKDINFKLDNSTALQAEKVRIVSCSSKKPDIAPVIPIKCKPARLRTWPERSCRNRNIKDGRNNAENEQNETNRQQSIKQEYRWRPCIQFNTSIYREEIIEKKFTSLQQNRFEDLVADIKTEDGNPVYIKAEADDSVISKLEDNSYVLALTEF